MIVALLAAVVIAMLAAWFAIGWLMDDMDELRCRLHNLEANSIDVREIGRHAADKAERMSKIQLDAN